MKIYKNLRTNDITIVVREQDDISIAVIQDKGEYEKPRYLCQIADFRSNNLSPYPSNECLLDNTEDVLCKLLVIGTPKKKRTYRRTRK